MDEAHNLKHGFSESGGSTRNALLATTFGRPLEGWEMPRWYGPRVKRLLLLSATPFEYDYADLWQRGGLAVVSVAGDRDALSRLFEAVQRETERARAARYSLTAADEGRSLVLAVSFELGATERLAAALAVTVTVGMSALRSTCLKITTR